MGQVAHLRRGRTLGPAGICGLAALLALCFADKASAATVNVCPTGAVKTVQDGVNAAVAGDTVSVCAETFREQVVIAKSLKLVGAGTAQTTIILPRPVAGSQDVVTVDGAGVNVEISGFTIKGLAPSAECAPLGTVYTLSGVYVRGGANANIHDNVITGMRGDPLDGCQKGSGIRVGRAGSSTSGTATITNNTISDIQKGGIVVDHYELGGDDHRKHDHRLRSDWGDRAERDPDLTRSDCDCHRRRAFLPATSTPALRSFSQPGCFFFGPLGETTVSNNNLAGERQRHLPSVRYSHRPASNVIVIQRNTDQRRRLRHPAR